MKYMRTRSLKRLFSLRRRILDGTNDDQEPLPTTATTKESEPATDKGIFPSMGLSNHTPPVPTDSKIATTEENLFPSNPPTWKLFSYEDIFTATNGFSPENMVGRGGYADVYQGTIPNTGKKVAVKKLTKATTEERREREFLTEIGTIGHASHPNVSSLLGCCIDNGLYLIFHLSPGGSVASRLHDEKLPVVEWMNRYKIAVGVAKGLHYLHKGCQRRIIHRDIKASNILLNDDYEPQISDFGLAKWLPTQLTHHSVVPIEGTVGCLAPEYFSHGIVDEKTDVFAFGVFLLELISGKRPVDAAHQSLRSWAKPYLKQGEVEKLVDPRLGGVYDKSELRRLVFTASICIRSSPNWRPTMSEVLELMLLEGEEMDGKKWEMPEKEEDKNEEEFWGFEALESDYEDDDDDDYNSSSSSFSASVTYDLISTGSS